MNDHGTEHTEALRTSIEAALDQYMRHPSEPEPELVKAMRYSLLLPGKRLRPMLTLLACEACGGAAADALPAACATEMVHAFSLIHDDLPAMDNDDLRRGKPTNHKVFGEALAILAGDALVAHAFTTITTHTNPAETARDCCRELSLATGQFGMCEGQARDMAAEKPKNADELAALHKHKTGALIVAALRMGAVAAKADTAKLDALTAYGAGLGLAFQITDDLLDVTSDAEAAGKAVGKDADAGKLTYPMLLGIAESRARAKSCIDEAIAALHIFGDEADPLRSIALKLLDRKS